MPKVWTLAQRGISRPAPACSRSGRRGRAGGCGSRSRPGRRGRGRRRRGSRCEAVGAQRPLKARRPEPADAPLLAPLPGANGRSATAPSRHAAYDDRQDHGPAPAGLAGADGLQLTWIRKRPAEGTTSLAPITYSSTASSASPSTRSDFGQRVEQAAVKLGFVHQGLSQEELDDLLDLAVSGEIAEPSSAPRRAHQRELGGPGRSLQPQPRPLDPPPRLPRRLARPAGQGGRARRRLRRAHPDLRLRPAGPQRRADRALQRAALAPHRLPALSSPGSWRSSAAETLERARPPVREPPPAAAWTRPASKNSLAASASLVGLAEAGQGVDQEDHVVAAAGAGARPGRGRRWRGAAGRRRRSRPAGRRGASRPAPRGWGRSAARPGRGPWSRRRDRRRCRAAARCRPRGSRRRAAPGGRPRAAAAGPAGSRPACRGGRSGGGGGGAGARKTRRGARRRRGGAGAGGRRLGLGRGARLAARARRSAPARSSAARLAAARGRPRSPAARGRAAAARRRRRGRSRSRAGSARTRPPAAAAVAVASFAISSARGSIR